MSLDKYRSKVRASKRAAILDAAIDEFLEKGFEGAGMTLIARQADVSTATLYKHFQSKDLLFDAIVEQLVGDIPKIISPSETEDQSFESEARRLCNSLADLLQREQIIPLFRTVVAVAYEFPHLRDLVYARGREPYRNALISLVEGAVDRGELSLKGNTSAFVAEQLLGNIYWFLLYSPIMDQRVKVSLDQARRIVNEALVMVMSRYSIGNA